MKNFIRHASFLSVAFVLSALFFTTSLFSSERSRKVENIEKISVHNISKKKDIIELIRTVVFKPEQTDILLPALVQQGIASLEKEAPNEEVVSALKSEIQEDSFFENVVAPFVEEFSHEEIKTLLGFFRSDVMIKFESKMVNELYTPIFNEIRESVTKILEAYPSIANDEPSSKEESSSEDEVISITEENFLKEVRESELPVVLDAYATWCGPCKRMEPILLELCQEMQGKIKFVKLNVDQQHLIANDLGIRSMPTFLFFKDGEIVGRHIGMIDKANFLEQIEKALGAIR